MLLGIITERLFFPSTVSECATRLLQSVSKKGLPSTHVAIPYYTRYGQAVVSDAILGALSCH